MSYVAREPQVFEQVSHCIMTDHECIQEAVEKIGGKVVGKVKQGSDIKIHLTNGEEWTLEYQIGRYAVTHMNTMNTAWLRNLQKQYSTVENAKREALRLEQERLKKLQKQMEAMNTRAAKAEKKGLTEKKQRELKQQLQERQMEIESSELAVKQLEAENNRIQIQKEELAEERTQEFVQRAERNWMVNVQRMPARRRTKLLLTR